MKEKQKRSFIAISIDTDLKNKYEEFCNNHGYAITKRVKLFIEKEINGKVKFDD